MSYDPKLAENEIGDVLSKMMERVPARSLLHAISLLSPDRKKLVLKELSPEVTHKEEVQEDGQKVQQKESRPVIPFKIDGRVPPNAVAKAMKIFEEFQEGQVRAIRFNVSKLFRSLNVGRDFRLFSRDYGQTWTLMSHQTFSKEVTRL